MNLNNFPKYDNVVGSSLNCNKLILPILNGTTTITQIWTLIRKNAAWSAFSGISFIKISVKVRKLERGNAQILPTRHYDRFKIYRVWPVEITQWTIAAVSGLTSFHWHFLSDAGGEDSVWDLSGSWLKLCFAKFAVALRTIKLAERCISFIIIPLLLL
jgi:hypothetical protein